MCAKSKIPIYSNNTFCALVYRIFRQMSFVEWKMWPDLKESLIDIIYRMHLNASYKEFDWDDR